MRHLADRNRAEVHASQREDATRDLLQGQHLSAPPMAIASRGMPNDDAGGLVLRHGSTAGLSHRQQPLAPSLPIPVRMTPTALLPTWRRPTGTRHRRRGNAG